MLIDTHCHLNIMANKEPEAPLTAAHFEEINAIIARAQEAGLSYLISVGTSLAESRNCIRLAERYDAVVATVGVHPCDITKDPVVVRHDLEGLLQKYRTHIVGIGETGLDYYHQPYNKDIQQQVFRDHLALAAQYNVPVVVHIRNAADAACIDDAGRDALAILEEYKERVCGVIHCFSLDEAAARTVIGWGWYIGIDGPITYPKNSALRSLVAAVPLSGLLLETDAPFLPPQALRGKRNCPSNLGVIAEAIAQARGCTLQEVVEVTTCNAKKLFSLR